MNGIESMAVFAIIEDIPEGDVPLIQDANKPDPAMWKLPGGRVESWESPDVGLYRELEEETGVVVFPVDEEDVIFEMKIGTHTFRVYRARYYCGEFKPNSDEIKTAEVFSADDVRQLLSHGRILPKHTAAIEKYLQGKETLKLAEKLATEA